METLRENPERPQYTVRPDRPVGVTCLSCLSAVGGGLALIIGLMLLAIPSDQIEPGAQGLISLSALLVFAVAGISFAAARGLWFLQKWAWYLSLAMEVLGIGLSAIQLLSGTNTLAEIIVAGIVVYYLYRRNVREAFGLD
jgi:hypothetical protein